MDEGSERGALLAPEVGRSPRLSRRFFALRLDMTEEDFLGSEEEEELSEMFKTGVCFEQEEDEALEGATSCNDLLAREACLRLGADCSAGGDGSKEC